jgi:REP element-mobilizing transposase RayT
MKDNSKFKNKYRIASARLREFDYSTDGYYFVTICTKNHRHFFGEIADGEMRLSEMGKIAQKCWAEIPEHFPFVKLDEFVVMPNHIHGIIIIDHSPVETHNYASPVCEKSIEKQDLMVLQDIKKTQNIASLRDVNGSGAGGQSGNLASVVRGFKIGVTKFAKANRINFAWQPRFYDHVIRKDESLSRIREYIRYNPINWNKDQYN